MPPLKKQDFHGPAIGKNGQFTEPWVRFFNELYRRMGNVDAGNYVDFGVDGSLGFNGQAKIAWKKITADSITNSGGNIGAFTVADLQTAADGNIFDYIEQAGAPNYLIVDFVGVEAFNIISCLASYDGSAAHSLAVGVYNWSTAAWDILNCLQSVFTNSGTVLCDHDFFIKDDTNYIGTGANSGQVRVRFYHQGTTINAHNWYFDEVALYQ